MRDCSWLLRKKIRGQLRDSVVKASQPTPNRLRTQVCEREYPSPLQILRERLWEENNFVSFFKSRVAKFVFEKKWH